MPEVFMPRLSDTMEEGVISSWLKQEGDTVERGDILAEIETDKAVMDLESYDSGVLRILVPAGTTVPIGQPIAVVGDADGTATPAAPAADTSPEPPPSPAPAAQAEAPVGQAAVATPPAATDGSASADEKVRATPLVRRLAREHGLDLTQISGSGPHGRIVRADVDRVLAEGSVSQARPAGQPATAPPAAAQPPAAQALPTDEEIPLTTIRKVTAERLSQSAVVPHFHLTAVVDTGPLLELRAELNRKVFEPETKVSVNDLLVRAVAVTLASHREVNSSWGGDKILRHGQVNVGIAVALEDGLIVPVIRGADRLTIGEISAEARRLATAARDRQLTPDQFNGGTFTVSNLGMFGIEQFTAVINPPQAAILAVGAARDEAVVQDGEITVRSRMRLTMTSDHRVLDGAVSAAFLRDLVGALEQPLRLLA